MPRAKSEHYVDNKKLFAEMKIYLESVKEAEESGASRPRVPEYIGECLLKISTRLSTKPNFINYTYRDEMISDGIENCINYIGNFNPEKSDNPFAYFTQIIYYAFLRRIQREKKQLYIKHKSLERSLILDQLATQGESGPDSGDQSAYVNLETPYMIDFVENFERKEEEKKQARKKKKGLENFVEEDNEETEDDKK
jgi:hypothetical protein